jgi:hypothetical protein
MCLFTDDLPMTILYHHTYSDLRGSIEREGLRRSYGASACGHEAVFLTNVPSVQCEGLDIWIVDVSGLEIVEDQSSPGADIPVGEDWFACYDQDISPDRLTLMV